MYRPRSVGRPWCATCDTDAWGTVACNLDPIPSPSSPHPPHHFARDLRWRCTRRASACLRISARHIAFFELLRVSTRGEARHPGPVAVVTYALTRLTRHALALLGTIPPHTVHVTLRTTPHNASARLAPLARDPRITTLRLRAILSGSPCTHPMTRFGRCTASTYIPTVRCAARTSAARARSPI